MRTGAKGASLMYLKFPGGLNFERTLKINVRWDLPENVSLTRIGVGESNGLSFESQKIHLPGQIPEKQVKTGITTAPIGITAFRGSRALSNVR